MNIKITTLSSTDAYCRPSSGINAINALFYLIQCLLLFYFSLLRKLKLKVLKAGLM